MKNEFRDRLNKKRAIIEKMKHKCKELALKDVTLLCEKCSQEVSQLKTVNYLSDDMHQAKCVFGHLKRVEELEAVKNADGFYSDPDNKDFIDLHLEIFKEKKREDEIKSEPGDQTKKKQHMNSNFKALPKYAFCACRQNHLVGIVIDQMYYFTDVSPLRMMFPQGHYEDWSSQYWQPGYRDAFDLQNKLNLKRASETRNHRDRYTSEKVNCELCQVGLNDADEFILHCNKHPEHINLAKQFMDESYDLVFEMIDKQLLQAKKDEEGLSITKDQ